MKEMKKWLSLILAAVLVLGVSSCVDKTERKYSPVAVPNQSDIQLKAAFLYSGGDKDTFGIYSQLEQSFLANVDIEKIKADKGTQAFEKYDIIYLDESVRKNESLKETLVSYVENGGYLFLANEFLTYFDVEFFGAKELVKLDSVPQNIEFPTPPENLDGVQGIIKDFADLYKHYLDYDELSGKDYGYGVVCDTAKSLADFGGVSIYGVNHYGKGAVFYTNPILPNSFHITDLGLENIEDGQTQFSISTATANRLILSEFAAYASKQKYGYAVKKILGSFGNPNMAWQLHYEEITGIENNSAILFGDMCKEYNTIPSFTLIRNSYKWFAKYETVTYLLNDGGNFFMDFNENAYSSGTHVIEEDEYLSLAEVGNGGSYFVDNAEFTQMAYPCVGDFNKDGIVDIISGSSDGRFYYFEGEGFENEWKVKKRIALTDTKQSEISVGSYSSPAITDIDIDGKLDIISGSEDGKLYLFKGVGDMQFEPATEFISDINLKRPMPSVGDLNSDGRVEIAVGSMDGKIKLLAMQQNGGYKLLDEIVCDGETFVAPHICDYDGDGRTDIIYGTFDGYIKRLKNSGKGYAFDGYYDTQELNYKGNNHIKFGNNCVPVLCDVNGDNEADLIAGELEYGLAIPIDSPYFKYRNQLQNQVDYMKDNRFYLGVHFYTNAFASKEREAEELTLQKKAFDSYGIDYSSVGVNMHTWYVSNLAHNQTMLSAKNAGFLWNSGWRPAFSGISPEAAAETVLACPFFMDFENREMMITNATALGYPQFNDYAYLTAKYDLPLTEFYHCDFAYSNEEAGRNIIEQVVEYKNKYSYNFVREDQFMKSAAAGYNMKLLSRLEDGKLILAAEGTKEDYPLYDENYQDCTGVKIEFADSVEVEKVSVNADVWRYDDEKRALYLGLNRGIALCFDADKNTDGFEMITENGGHILSVNIPADIEFDKNKATIRFEDDGMMQVSVLGKVKNVKGGFLADYKDGITTMTRFGDRSDLEFTFK